MDDETWRNKGAIRLVTVFDMILSLFLFGFYIIAGLIMNTVVFQATNGPFSKLALVGISLILWAVVFVITYLQLAAAYRLFLVTFQDALGPQIAVNRSQSWLRTAIVVICLIVFKIVYFLFREPSPHGLVWTLCVLEIIIRFLGVYYVREFCDDLKHHISSGLRRAPSIVRYVNETADVAFKNPISVV